MKKYLLGLIAIVFAIGLSAFALNKAHSDKSTTTYWWYDALTEELLNDDGKTELPPGTDCELVGGDICAYGHEDPTNQPSQDPDETAHFVTE